MDRVLLTTTTTRPAIYDYDPTNSEWSRWKVSFTKPFFYESLQHSYAKRINTDKQYIENKRSPARDHQMFKTRQEERAPLTWPPIWAGATTVTLLVQVH